MDNQSLVVAINAKRPEIIKRDEQGDKQYRTMLAFKDFAISDNVVDIFEKVSMIRIALEGDKLACEATWTLFVAAAHSFRYNSCLLPCPPRFMSEEKGLDIALLMSVINITPQLTIVLKLIKDYRFNDMGREVLELLYWVLVDGNEHWLRRVRDREVTAWFAAKGIQRPTYAFEVCQPLGSRAEKRFREYNRDTPSKIAYYGDKMDCFYLLMSNGFIKKNEVILTPHIRESLRTSMDGASWGCLTNHLLVSCVALCEYLDHPTYIKHKQMKRVAHSGDYEAIVTNNTEIVRIRYLLFYDAEDGSDLMTSLWQHRHPIALTTIILIMAGVNLSGLMGAPHWNCLLRKWASSLNIPKHFFRFL